MKPKLNDTRRREWAALQTAYRAANEALSNHRLRLRVRFGSHAAALAYAGAHARHRYEVLERAERRAYARIYRWLDRHSPWDWHSGTSAHWTCTTLTVEQALADSAPTLPADSAAWGMPHRERTPEPRGAALEARS